MATAKEEGFDRLKRVSTKRKEWATLPVLEKLAILEEIQKIMTIDMKYEDWRNHDKGTAKMMGFDTDTIEGNCEVEQQMLATILVVKTIVNAMVLAYRIRAGVASPPKELTKGNFKTRKAPNGQIVVKTFPTLPGESTGLFAAFKGEVWLDSSKIQDESQVEAFDFENAWKDGAADNEKGSLMFILGAGNQSFLTILDILQGMFVGNYVVYMKQHPIRTYANTFISRLYAPLISRGYLGIEAHTTIERSSALVYHPDVDALHMTGGKATHDLLVWGADPIERERNLKAKTPILKATVTSELGAVSPWIVVPSKYKKTELKSQAAKIANYIHNNASCNCNTPKIIIVADEWDQKDDFLKIIEDELIGHPAPVAYYPNIKKRWENFANRYPDCKRLETNTGLGIKERNLSAGGMNEKPLLLPYLQIVTKVDLKTDSGREAASKEYAFTNEPFAPVYTITTLQGTGQKDILKFGQIASTFCNEYLFGSLSGSISCPESILNDDSVQSLLAELKYGSICVNNSAAHNYVAMANGMWGAFPGETIDAVESGIGKLGNIIAIPHMEKFVMVSPIDPPGGFGELKDDLEKWQRICEAINRWMLNGSVGNLIKLLSVIIGINFIGVGVACTSFAAAGLAYFMKRK